MDWSGFTDRLVIVTWIIVSISAVPVILLSTRQFWRDRFRLPAYIHALALIAAAIGAWMAFGLENSPIEGRIPQFVFTAIMPLLVYVGWIRFGGPLVKARQQREERDHMADRDGHG